ncbi:MAG: S8 family serine peptidase [bacterium]
MRCVLILLLMFGLTWVARADPGYRATLSDRHKLRVEDREVAQRLIDGGAELVADYGSFQVLEVNREGKRRFSGRDRVEDRDEGNWILLNAGAIDTTDGATPAARTALRSFIGKRLHLVQFRGPVKPEWLDELAGTGVQIVTYVPHNAYLVYGDAGALARVTALKGARPHVQWEGGLVDSDKIHPRARRSGVEWYAIQLVEDEPANEETRMLLDALKLEPVRQRNRVLHYINLVVRLPPGAIDGIAAQPDVVSIHAHEVPKKLDERQDQIVAGLITGTQPTGPGYLAWLASKGFAQTQFNGSGFSVDVTDSGIDNATLAPNHFGLYNAGNVGLTSRVMWSRLEGTPNSGSTRQGCDGHGNINAHIIAGYNDLSGFPHTDSDGFHYGLGVCPFVRVGSSVIFDPDYYTWPDFEDMISRAYNDGARISSDSWGANVYGDYDDSSQAYDVLVRDAQPAGAAVSVTGNQEMVIVFAAGNSGPYSQTVGSPATAKNIITVGAAENVHSHALTNGGNASSGSDGCGFTDADNDSTEDMATFSSRGPCSDGRQKPDVVAPGSHITGGVAQEGPPTDTGTGNDLSCFKASGVCALPGQGGTGNPNNFFPTNQQFWSTSSGTSHSTPAVAGGCALIRQYFINHEWGIPSPAMVKAYLMNSTRYMTGLSANDNLWSAHQGMGAVNLGTAFDDVYRMLSDQETTNTFTATGQTRVFEGTVTDTGKPFRVTLAWSDAPGSTIGNAFNNDLDLTLSIDGSTFKGNVFNGAYAQTGGVFDLKNNVENVFLPPGYSGAFTVTVSAASINSDGVPNEAPSIDQDFALVIYNATPPPSSDMAVESAMLQAESCGAGNGAIDPEENVTVAFVFRNNGNADATNLVVALEAGGGVLSPDGPFTNGFVAAGGDRCTNVFTFATTGTCGGLLSATFQFLDNDTDIGNARYTITMGETYVTNVSVTNNTAMPIPVSGTTNVATPYPSPIAVGGVFSAVTKATVRLAGLSHANPDDLDILLVNPTGQKIILMSDAGGTNAVSNVDLVFDATATSSVPDSALITSGTYAPTNHGNNDTFPAPAPGAPHNAGLATLNGLNPNGTWYLYVVDDAGGSTGVLAQGWSLTLATTESRCCATNKPPTLAPIGNKSITVSNLIQFTVTATDFADGDPVALSALGVPAWATFDTVTNVGTVTNVFTGTPTVTGTYAMTFIATDKDGSDTENIQVTVATVGGGDTLWINEIHYDNSGLDVNEGVEIAGIAGLNLGDYALYFYDRLTTNVYLTNQLSGLIYDEQNGYGTAWFFVPAIQNGGTDAVALVRGGTSMIQFLSYEGIYTNGNKGPAAGMTAVNIGVAESGSSLPGLSLQLFGTGIQYSAFTWQTNEISATRGTRNANQAFLVVGPPTNLPASMDPVGNKSVTVSNQLQFTVTGTETDGDPLTLTASNMPAGAVFGATGAVGAFTFVPSSEQVGICTTVFYATDMGGSTYQSIFITVNPGSGATNELIYFDFETPDNQFENIPQAYAGNMVVQPMSTADGSITNYQGNPGTGKAIADNSWLNATNYFTLTVTVSNGYEMEVVGLRFDDRGLSTGPTGWRLRHSGDGYASDVVAGVPHLQVWGTNNVTFSIGSLTGSVTFRIHGDNASAGIGTWRMDNFRMFGTVRPGFADTDADGMEDNWELDNFGSLTNATSTSDADNDRFLDLHEYLAGTEPTNNQSYLKAFSPSNAPSGNFIVKWSSVANRFYILNRSTNLVEGFSGIASNLAATAPENTYTDAIATSAVFRTYRIQLQ